MGRPLCFSNVVHSLGWGSLMNIFSTCTGPTVPPQLCRIVTNGRWGYQFRYQITVGPVPATWHSPGAGNRVQPPFGDLMGELSPRAESDLAHEQCSGICAQAAGHCSARSQTVLRTPQGKPVCSGSGILLLLLLCPQIPPGVKLEAARSLSSAQVGPCFNLDSGEGVQPLIASRASSAIGCLVPSSWSLRELTVFANLPLRSYTVMSTLEKLRQEGCCNLVPDQTAGCN